MYSVFYSALTPQARDKTREKCTGDTGDIGDIAKNVTIAM